MVANSVLRLAIDEQRGVLIQHLQFEMVELVAPDRANRAAHESHHFRFICQSAEADLHVVVGEKFLKELAVPIFPSLPRLLLQLYQLLFDRSFVGGLGDSGQVAGENKYRREREEKNSASHKGILFATTGKRQSITGFEVRREGRDETRMGPIIRRPLI